MKDKSERKEKITVQLFLTGSGISESCCEHVKNQIKACGFNLFEVNLLNGGGPYDVINYWNEGVLIVTYEGHGSPYGWQIFNTGYISSLDNGYKLPFVLSGGCRTGLFGSTKIVTPYFSEQLLFEEGGWANTFTGWPVLILLGSFLTTINSFLIHFTFFPGIRL